MNCERRLMTYSGMVDCEFEVHALMVRHSIDSMSYWLRYCRLQHSIRFDNIGINNNNAYYAAPVGMVCLH